MSAQTLYGLFRCPTCENEWADDLPPLWTAYDLWPTCQNCASFPLALLEDPDVYRCDLSPKRSPGAYRCRPTLG